MNARAWSVRLGWILDALGLGALAATGEIRPWVYGVAALMLLARRTALHDKQVSQNFMLFLYGLVFTGSLVAWLSLHEHPVLVAANATPVIHGLLWLPTRTGKAAYRSIRLGLGFVELILAAVLTTELYLPATIIVFVILGAVTLSTTFLDEELRKKAPDHSEDPLPPAYIREGIALALVIFLSAIIIFPLLPRAKGAGSWQGPGTQTGYTESVDISRWSTRDGGGDQRPVLRMYSNDSSQDIALDIHLGLLRTRTLDVFDGKQWQPSFRQLKPVDENFVTAGKHGPPSHIEIVREPLHTASLPVPYGTIDAVAIDEENAETFLRPQANGEWLEGRSTERRLTYRIVVTPTILKQLAARRELDEPQEIHLALPESAQSPRLKKLASKIFANARTERQKVLALMAFLSGGGFVASYGGEDSQDPGAIIQSKAFQALSPIEQFLFVRKTGHCEWFASAAAILLRLGGVPTRLVAGFRLSRSAVGGVLTVRNSDAHAWLETWGPESGWTPLDPTPRVYLPPSLLEFFRGTYDLASAFWSRYVVAYDGGEVITAGRTASTELLQSIRKGPQAALRDHPVALGAALAALLIAAIALARSRWVALRSGRTQVSVEGPPPLRRERKRMERLLRGRFETDFSNAQATLAQKLGTGGAEVFSRWKSTYERARFGPEADAGTTRELRAHYEQLKGVR